jgi:hypothetical protein
MVSMRASAGKSQPETERHANEFIGEMCRFTTKNIGIRQSSDGLGRERCRRGKRYRLQSEFRSKRSDIGPPSKSPAATEIPDFGLSHARLGHRQVKASTGGAVTTVCFLTE